MPTPAPTPDDFPAGDSRMAAEFRAFDWSTHVLGPTAGWPVVLRVAVNMMLASSFPQCMAWGPQRTLLYNDAYRPMLGNKPAPLGKPIDEVWAEVWPDIRPLLERAYAGEATFVEDLPLVVERHGRPEQAWFTFCYSPVRDERGQVLGMLDTALETTGKMLAEQRLTEAAASLERQVAERTADRNRLWQLSSDLMLVARLDGVVLAVNPAWTQLLGWREDETLGADVMQLVHDDDRQASLAQLQQLAQGHALHRFDNRMRHRDGSYRWISWTATPGDGALSAVGRDVTAEREQADALRRTEEMLRHSQKMEAVGQLTGGLAHDFNNLLQGITGSLQLMERLIDRGRHGELGRYITSARGAARRAATLTHRLLAFSRRQTLAPRPTDLNELVAGMEELIHRSLGPGIELQHAPAPGLWLTRVDADQLESALLNLCINARDAMPDGGRLQLTLANLQLADEAAALDLPAGDYVALSVTDTGTGMPPEVVARAFDPFFTTKPIGRGTGLGLSMVYGFARQSGGQVQIDSAPGQGTTVRILLPRSNASVAQPAPAVAASSTHAAGPKLDGQALVVEDNAEVRMLVVEALREQGLTVTAMEDGPRALGLLQTEQPFDLLVTDVGLPGGLNGRQLADAAVALRPRLRVLFITGYADNAALGAADLAAGMDVLVKPFTLEALLARVKGLLEGPTAGPPQGRARPLGGPRTQ
ncbi:ATP-binding protein [Aquincola tertiaricarbonis]|uniref:histidine kinase n=1 Tax=Aquincola tertiaricarbonis TaxID=391953 RepID=A0ABY4RYM2_AQUTE|nr:ATP-binding protein [Aquincola tertiaricarbonis]URI05866.1 ATP-binding protein [Aquincola tertiaricarbonis]